MNDRDDDEKNPKEKPSQGVDPMRRFVNQLILLEDFCKRLAADRETWALTGVDFSDKVEEIKKEVEELKLIPSEIKKLGSEMNKNLIQLLIEENRRSAEILAKGVGQVLQKAIASHVDENIQKLDNAFVNTSNRLDGIESRWESMMKWFALAGFGAIILGGLVAGGLVSYRFPAQTFTEEQSRLMKNGRILDSAWKNLSKQEKDRFNEASSK